MLPPAAFTSAARSLVLAACLIMATLSYQTQAQAQDHDESHDYSEFYDRLSDSGHWIDHPRFGYVWAPDDIDEDWRPYTRGRWIYTEDYGWYWQSDERFGWATYHYGRWVRDEIEGWLWIPGNRWGPAWVAWRSNEDYIGWAPLPPEAEWFETRGFSYRFEEIEQPRFAPLWIFCRPRYFATEDLSRHFADRDRSITLINRTTIVNNYTTVNNTIFNGGVERRRVEVAGHRPVPIVRIVSSERHEDREARPRFTNGQKAAVAVGVGAAVIAGSLSVYRPKIATVTPGRAPIAPKAVAPFAGPNAGPAGAPGPNPGAGRGVGQGNGGRPTRTALPPSASPTPSPVSPTTPSVGQPTPLPANAQPSSPNSGAGGQNVRNGRDLGGPSGAPSNRPAIAQPLPPPSRPVVTQPQTPPPVRAAAPQPAPIPRAQPQPEPRVQAAPRPQPRPAPAVQSQPRPTPAAAPPPAPRPAPAAAPPPKPQPKPQPQKPSTDAPSNTPGR